MEAGKRQDQRLLPAPAEFSGRLRVIRARHLSKYGPRKGRGWNSMPPGGEYVSGDQLVGTARHSPLSTVITQKKNFLRIKIRSCKLIYFWINVSHFVNIQVLEKLCCN